MTLFSLYKVIKCPSVEKFDTITEPFSGDEAYYKIGREYLKFLSLKHSFRFDRRLLQKDYGLLMMETSSPSYSSS